MKLTFFGGIREIGGSKVFLQDKNTAIFLDFGKKYHEPSKYFEEFKKRYKKVKVVEKVEILNV